MRICQSCGLENPPERDFCSCGEYLRWEPTVAVQSLSPEVAARAAREAAAPPATPEPPAPEARRQLDPSSARPAARPAATPAAPAPAPQPAAAEPASAAIVLRLPEGEPANEGTLSAYVQPGSRARVLALVRNQSRIVDNYDLWVEGLPDGWWSIHPERVYLVPYGSAGTYEQEVEVHLHPPATPEAQARPWELRVVADSTSSAGEVAAAPLILGIGAYTSTSTKIRPERAKGRRRARFEVDVANEANAPVLVALEGADQDGELEFGFDRPPQEIGPGRSVTTGVRVKPPRQIWVGRATDHRFELITLTGEQAAERLAAEPLPAAVLDEAPAPRRRFGRGSPAAGRYGPRVFKPQVRPPGASVGPGGVNFRMPQVRGPRIQGPRVPRANLEFPGHLGAGGLGGAPPAAPLLPTQAIFRQKPWIGWWVLPLLLLLAIAAVIVYFLLPKTVTVPNLVSSPSKFEAQQKLNEADLRLNPQTGTEPSDEPPGTVLRQTPRAGAKADKDSPVTVQVAIGSGQVKVPSLAGMTVEQADAALRKSGLTLGTASPQPPDLEAPIEKQIPAAEQSVGSGTPVNVFMKGAEKDEAEAKAKAEEAKDGGGKGGPVPAIAAGGSVAAAEAALRKAGLEPKPVEAFDAKAKLGTVVATDPPAGTDLDAGAEVQILVSAGSPKLAFDDGKNLLLVDGLSAKKLASPAKGPQDETHPTWSPDGERLAYVAGGRLFLKDMTDPSSASTPITPEGKTFTAPAWAPTPEADVLAMVQIGSNDDRDLCVGRLTPAGVTPRCIKEPDFDVSRVHWAPDGASILALGVKEPGTFGIVRWTSSTPFSPDRRAWGEGEFVSDSETRDRGAIDAALSPDGNTLAIVSNQTGGEFRLVFTEPDDFLLTNPRATEVRACEVAWRPDGREVVVRQGDADCREGAGPLTAVDASDPRKVRPLSPKGDHPAFEPLTSGS